MSHSTENITQPQNPITIPYVWNLVAAGYNRSSRNFLAPFSDLTIERLDLSADLKCLDVSCGPGTATLKLAGITKHVIAVDFSEKMIEQLQTNLRNNEVKNVTAIQGNGQNLPLQDASFDVALSMFGLFLFPDRFAGFKELHRVLRRGGRAAVSSWAPIGRSTFLQAAFGALRAADPSRPESVVDMTSLQNPEVFRKEMEESGFGDVSIQTVKNEVRFLSADDFWESMLEGSPTIALMKEKRTSADWKTRSNAALAFLETLEWPANLRSVVYLGIGTKK